MQLATFFFFFFLHFHVSSFDHFNLIIYPLHCIALTEQLVDWVASPYLPRCLSIYLPTSAGLVLLAYHSNVPVLWIWQQKDLRAHQQASLVAK
ncbi:hypothetical protein J3F84DRAFT_278613 [Trichoderma pleuroticola]